MKKHLLGLFYLIITSLILSCDSNNKDMNIAYTDWHTYANPQDIHPDHLNLDIAVDFEKHTILGKATWNINPEVGTDFAIFDTWKLDIEKVELDDGIAAEYELGEFDPVLGSPLKVKITEKTRLLTIHYRSSPDAIALQWLEPSQTFGKQTPYLFTQGQTIYTRSWVPTPDSPGARFTYEATVQVPEGLMVLMSAENPQEKSNDGIYHFKMIQKIPAYLMALAVGDIAFRSVDHRTGVYAEPAILEKAYNELDEIGGMVTIAESLYGKYRWDRYDVLVLPSGFPIGGMENPRITFSTPTILAGDKSLVNLIAHELAHSWSGNLVTNANWDDFWINEGFTVYFERRITEAQYGKDYVAMLWDLSLKELQDEIDFYGADSRRTWLKEDLKGLDPEVGFTSVPYEKGSALLLLIEQTVGRENLDKFLIKYFDEHAFKSMTTEYLLDYMNKHLLDKNPEWKDKIKLDQWVYGPGIPDNYPVVENKRFQEVDKQIALFLEGKTAAGLSTAKWSTYEWLRFLNKMPEDLSVERMKDLDAQFHLTQTGNSEIADAWYLQALKSGYIPAYDAMKEFLYVTGRQKFLEPLYRQMMKTDSGQKLAEEIYQIARPNYHPLAQKNIDGILGRK